MAFRISIELLRIAYIRSNRTYPNLKTSLSPYFGNACSSQHVMPNYAMPLRTKAHCHFGGSKFKFSIPSPISTHSPEILFTSKNLLPLPTADEEGRKRTLQPTQDLPSNVHLNSLRPMFEFSPFPRRLSGLNLPYF